MDEVTPNLPVADALPALLAALAEGNAVLVAPPGAGKTTLVPPALLHATWLGDGRIVMLEPRRLAARAAAARMSALLGTELGGLVGYRTRLDSRVSAATRIEVVTEGLLVRRLQSDPGLDGVACVIFDEVHERSLDADLALAFCLDLQRGLRPEVRLLAMSATADGARLGPLMRASLIESAGRQYETAIEHTLRDIAGPRALPDAMAAAIRGALLKYEGDVLAFLPGMGEIRRVQAALQGCPATVLALHGDLPPTEQDRALRSMEEGRRVVLSSSIAETSLTVPGVRIVVDGGWRRTPSHDAALGLTRLVTRRISRAAAEQRAGRAGRERRAWPSGSGASPCTAACRRSTGRKSSRPSCRAWRSTAPPGEQPPPSCRSPTRRRPGRWPPHRRCWPASAHSRAAASPRAGGRWQRSGRSRDWRR